MTWSPLATVHNIREFPIGISGNSSCTFTHQIDHFLRMELQIFKSHNESWIIRFQIFLVPLRPVMCQGVIFHLGIIVDLHMNRVGGNWWARQGKVIRIGNKIRTVCFTAWPFGGVWMIALNEKKKTKM